MRLRFGAAGFGLPGFQELGLRRLFPGLDDEELAEWARARYTRGNAALWVAGLEPFDVDIPLLPGERIPCSEPEQVQGLVTPAYSSEGKGGVMLSLVGRRTSAFSVAAQLLEKRIHERLRLRAGLSYTVSGAYAPLDGLWAHVAFAADSLSEHERLVREEVWAELEEFAANGPTAQELEQVAAGRLCDVQDPLYSLAELDFAVFNELAGAPVPSRADLAEDIRELTSGSVAAAVDEILSSAIMLASDRTFVPAGFCAHSYGAGRNAVHGKCHPYGEAGGLPLGDSSGAFRPSRYPQRGRRLFARYA